jgi:Family of unknown function (DUF5677)
VLAAILSRMPNRKKASPPPEVSPAQLRKATDEIATLIEDRLPLQLPPEYIWPPVAHGFLARAGTLLESVTLSVERGMPGEAQMLLRILIEHVAIFCWLAINPEPHIARWREWAEYRSYQIHKNAKERFGIERLTPTEAAKAKEAKQPMKLHKLASAVDRHWSEISPAFRSYDPNAPEIRTFIGVYTAVYSKTSSLVHADPVSIERFMTMPLRGEATIHAREKRSESNDYPSFALAMMGFLLVAFEHHFSWPARDLIEGITGVLATGDG